MELKEVLALFALTWQVCIIGQTKKLNKTASTNERVQCAGSTSFAKSIPEALPASRCLFNICRLRWPVYRSISIPLPPLPKLSLSKHNDVSNSHGQGKWRRSSVKAKRMIYEDIFLVNMPRALRACKSSHTLSCGCITSANETVISNDSAVAVAIRDLRKEEKDLPVCSSKLISENKSISADVKCECANQLSTSLTYFFISLLQNRLHRISRRLRGFFLQSQER